MRCVSRFLAAAMSVTFLASCGLPNVINGGPGANTAAGGGTDTLGLTPQPGATNAAGEVIGLDPNAPPPPGISANDPSLAAIASASAAAQARQQAGAPVPGSERGNGKGVSEKFVDIAMHYPTQQCGVTGAWSEDEKDRIFYLVKWFNTYVNFPNKRQIRYTIVDDAGPDPECQDKARASGIRIAKELKSFAALGYSINVGADLPIIADTVTHNGTLHIGKNFETVHDFHERIPYAWSLTKPGEVSYAELVQYINVRVKGTPYTDDNGIQKPRSYGMLFFDGREGHYLADTLKKQMAGIGIPVKQYYMNGDAGTAAQQAAALAVQMNSDGINTLILGIAGTPAFASTNAFDGQGYHPDNLISDYGGYWFALFNDVYGQGQLKRMSGIAIPCILCERLNFSAAEPTDAEHCPTCDQVDNGGGMQYTYKQAGGQNTNPANGTHAGQHYQLLSMLAIGMLHAGPVLNPWTFQAGMFVTEKNRCAIERYAGRTHPQLPYQAFFPGRYWAMTGYTTLYWTPKQAKFGTAGYFESFDNYERHDKPSDLTKLPRWDTGKKDLKLIVHKKTGLKPNTNC